MSNDLHALAGAYVMDALDEEERAAFEAFLAESPATAAEVASLQEAVAMLGAAAAETPPEGLRRAVLDEIDTVRQLPPVVAARPPARLTPPAPPTAPPAGPTPASVTTLQPRHQSWTTRLAVAAAAVAIFVAGGLGVSLARLDDRIQEVQRTNAEVAGLLAAPDGTRHEATLPDGGRITALISSQQSTAVTVASGLPDLDEDRMYALWGIVDGSPVPVGELVNGEPLTFHSAGLDALGLTVEPRGELTLPTGSVQATLGA